MQRFQIYVNEKANQTLLNMIRYKTNQTQRKVAWSTIAQEDTKIYNETEYTITGFRHLEGEDAAIQPTELQNRNT